MRVTAIIESIAVTAILITINTCTWRNNHETAMMQNMDNNDTARTIQQTETSTITVQEVIGNQDVYVEKKIRVRGRITARPHYSAGPCISSEPCPPIINITLHLANTDTPVNDRHTASLDLFEQITEKTFKPLTCAFISEDTFDCSPYIQNTVTTVEGIFIKHRVPYHTVGTSSGALQVLKYIDMYIFVPDVENLKNTNPCETGQTQVYEQEGVSRCVDVK